MGWLWCVTAGSLPGGAVCVLKLWCKEKGGYFVGCNRWFMIFHVGLVQAQSVILYEWHSLHELPLKFEPNHSSASCPLLASWSKIQLKFLFLEVGLVIVVRSLPALLPRRSKKWWTRSLSVLLAAATVYPVRPGGAEHPFPVMNSSNNQKRRFDLWLF